MSAPTVKDIAKLSGVSTGTVDRVLHNRGRVSPSTARRVNEVARELRFQLNPHASNLARTRAFTIAVIMPREDQDSGYWRLPVAGMREAVRELQPYQVHLHSRSFLRGSTRSFLRATKSVLADPPDAVAIAPVLADEAQRFVERLPPHIPVCCIDTELPGGRASYVGQDAQASGRLAAKLMRLMLAPETHPVIIQPVEEDVHIRGRAEGFVAGIAGVAGPGGGEARPGVATFRGEEARPGVTTLRGEEARPGVAKPRGEEARPGVATPRGEEARGGARRSGGSARDGSAPVPLYAHPLHDAAAARGLVVRVFEEHPRLGGIFVTNALVHLVGQALTELGRGTLPLIGYDVLPENRAQLEAGVIDFLISQRPGLQGRRAIMLLFEMLQQQGTAGAARGEPAREIMPLDMVTAENIGYYIDL